MRLPLFQVAQSEPEQDARQEVAVADDSVSVEETGLPRRVALVRSLFKYSDRAALERKLMDQRAANCRDRDLADALDAVPIEFERVFAHTGNDGARGFVVKDAGLPHRLTVKQQTERFRTEK